MCVCTDPPFFWARVPTPFTDASMSRTPISLPLLSLRDLILWQKRPTLWQKRSNALCYPYISPPSLFLSLSRAHPLSLPLSPPSPLPRVHAYKTTHAHTHTLYTDRQTDRQTDRHTHTRTHIHGIYCIDRTHKHCVYYTAHIHT